VTDLWGERSLLAHDLTTEIPFREYAKRLPDSFVIESQSGMTNFPDLARILLTEPKVTRY